MDWGFLVGFTLGSMVLFVYHIWWLHELTTSNKRKYVQHRSTMFHLMIEFGELEEVRKEKDDNGN